MRRAGLLIFALVAAVTAVAHAQTAAGPTVRLEKGILSLNGSPFFPIMGGTPSACPDRGAIDNLVSIGVGVVLHTQGTCGGDYGQALDAALSGRPSGTVWWYEQDAAAQQQLANMPELLDWQANTVLAFDSSSLIGCRSRSSRGLYDAIRAKAGSEVAVIAELSIGGPAEGAYTCSNSIRATNQLATSIVAGAKGVFWGTFNPRNAYEDNGFSVPPDVATAVTVLDKRLQQTLDGPILQGTVVKVTFSPSSTIVARGWKYKNAIYIIASNTQDTPTSSSVVVKGVRTSKVIPMWGMGRRHTAVRGGFKDTYMPLGVHIFKLVLRR